MIAKIVKGKGFRGALNYDLQKEKGRLLDTNMAGENPRELAREFGEIRSLRPNLGNAVCHISLSIAPDEQLTDGQWREVAEKTLDGMGFSQSQYVVTKHEDTKHPHIHILVNRVNMSGEAVSDSHDYKRLENIMRSIENEYGLQVVKPSREAERRAPSKGEIERVLRTGKASIRMRLQNAVDTALHPPTTLSDFMGRLAACGIETRLNQASTGRISGVSFSLDGTALKGSDLGKAYTWNSLQKRGITHEQDGYSKGNEFGRNPETHIGTAGEGVERSGNIGDAPDLASKNGHGETEKHRRVDENFARLEQAYKDIDLEHSRSRSRGQGLSR